MRWGWGWCAGLAWCALGAQALAERAEMLTSAEMDGILAADPALRLDFRNPNSVLSRLLIPRVPGTENSTIAREAIISTLSELRDAQGSKKWHIETPSFEAQTPEGVRKMTNVIATRDPSAPRRLVLAAHYDSKFFPPGPMEGFIGATDSAAPCAVLLDVAVALDTYLDRQTERMAQWRTAHPGSSGDSDVTLQLIFLDGEEAFHSWTHTDSVYGARDLANSWAERWVVPHRKRHTTRPGFAVRAIQQIENFVLLDLLGAPNPRVPYFFEQTKWLHTLLQQIETRLSSRHALYPDNKQRNPIMDARRGPAGIEDDHLPFLAQGVPILHLIPVPFPIVWHQITDNVHALDYATLFAWSKLMRVFVAEYLGLGQQK